MKIKLTDGMQIEIPYAVAEELYDKLSGMIGPESMQEVSEWDELILELGNIEKN